MIDTGRCSECGSPAAVRRSGGAKKDSARLCSSDACRRARKKKTLAKWYSTHRAKRLKYLSDYQQKHKDDHPEYFRKHYAENKDRRKQQSNAWYHANAERVHAVQRVWVASNPEKVRASSRKSSNKRRAIKKRVFVESVDPRVVFERDKGKCGICMKRVESDSRWEIDHIMPISRGGAHSYDNVQLAHRKCNRSKSAKLPAGQPTLFQVVPA